MGRAVPVFVVVGVLVVGGFIFAMSQGGEDKPADKSVPTSTIDTSDTKRWPWKLQRALDTAGLDWEDVPGRVYNSKRSCERHRSEIMKTTNRLHRCERR